MRTRYEIEIGRLVLDGVPAAHRKMVREAVEREVARRAAEGRLGGDSGAAGRPWTLPAVPPGRRSS